MTEALVVYVLALAGGLLLGVIFYGGLWITVQWLPFTPRPALLMAFSFLSRVLVAMIGFHLIMDGQALRLLMAVAGFLAARVLIPVFINPRLRPDKSSPKVVRNDF